MPGGLPRPDRRRPLRPADRRGTRRGGLPRRARAQPVRLGLRARVRRPLRGRVPARQHRRPDLYPCPQALRHGAVRGRVAPTRHPGPLVRPVHTRHRGTHPRGQRLPRAPPAHPPGRTGPRPAPQGGGDRGGSGRALRRPRPRPPRLRRHRLRRLVRAGRDDALRHPRVPPSPHPHPRGDPEDRGPRGHPALGGRPSPRPSAWPSFARRASSPSSSPSASRRAATCRSRASSSTGSSRPWTTCST